MGKTGGLFGRRLCWRYELGSELFPISCARPRTHLALQAFYTVNKARYVTFTSAPAFWPTPAPRVALALTSLEPQACVGPPSPVQPATWPAHWGPNHHWAPYRSIKLTQYWYLKCICLLCISLLPAAHIELAKRVDITAICTKLAWITGKIEIIPLHSRKAYRGVKVITPHILNTLRTGDGDFRF